MDEQTRAALNQIVPALKAFTRSVEKSFHHGMYEGATNVMVRQYRTLHSKVAEILRDDFYVNDSLVLVLGDDANDEEKISQVVLLSDQLSDYLQNLVKAEQQTELTASRDEIHDLGREVQEQILNLTKQTLKRALSHIDVEVNVTDDEETPPEPEPKPEE